MGYLDDLQTISRTVSSGKQAISSLQRKSIARGALDSTMQFSFLVPDSLPIDESNVLARFLERTYASFAQQYLSMNSTVNISVDKNPETYLKRFHQNIKLEKTAEDVYNEYCTESRNDDVKSLYEDYDNLMDRVYDGSTVCYTNESGNFAILFNFTDEAHRTIYEENKAALEESLAAIDMYPFPNVGNSPFYEAPMSPDEVSDYIMQKEIDTRYRNQTEILKSDLSDKREILKTQISHQGRVPVITDADVKKSNDMQPYTMQVRLMAVNDKNEFVQFMDFLVGIKVVLHVVKSEEMIVNLQSATKNNDKVFNFIRWTTGEKKLIKDLLLHMDETRLDIANRSKGASRWWVTFKRLKMMAGFQKFFHNRTAIPPNATIAITGYEADTIKKQYGYDLTDPLLARRLMNALYLMNFVIVDEGTRTIQLLYEGSTAFQTYALETLEREVSLSSNKIGKEIGRMISTR